MPRRFKNVAKKVGLDPGTIVPITDKKFSQTKITIFEYDQNQYSEKEYNRLEDCQILKDKPTVSWINIDGIQEVAIIEKINELFGIHPLVLEDIANTSQHPKIEDYGHYIFIVLKMLFIGPNGDSIESEHTSLILGSNYVISFQENISGDVFDPVRERIRHNKGRLRKMSADFLAYSLMDCIVDRYFIILEHLDEKIEVLDNELLKEDFQRDFSYKIQKLKREIIFLRKQVWPLRELSAELYRGESNLIKKSTSIYLRDVYDHTIQIIETIDLFRDILSGMHDIYLSTMSNKLNEIMKILTIITTIFIPLSFIAGIYGMNFKYMPELQWRWGYFAVLAFMTCLSILMVIYFKRKRWF